MGRRPGPQRCAWARQQRTLIAQDDWTDPALGRISFGEYVLAWLDARTDLKPKTRDQYQSLLVLHILPTWGTVPLGKVTFEGLSQRAARLHRGGLGPSGSRQSVLVMSAALEHAVRSGRIILGTPKSHQCRTVPVPPFLAHELAVTLDGRKSDDLVFTMPGGSYMRLSNWRQATFLPARARATVSERFRIHDLRHTAASLMIQAGYPPKRVQAILGHGSITTTLGLYGQLYPGDMDRYSDRLGDAAEAADPAKIGQMSRTTTQGRRVWRGDLGKVWRARRDSNPQPSDP